MLSAVHWIIMLYHCIVQRAARYFEKFFVVEFTTTFNHVWNKRNIKSYIHDMKSKTNKINIKKRERTTRKHVKYSKTFGCYEENPINVSLSVKNKRLDWISPSTSRGFVQGSIEVISHILDDCNVWTLFKSLCCLELGF